MTTLTITILKCLIFFSLLVYVCTDNIINDQLYEAFQRESYRSLQLQSMPRKLIHKESVSLLATGGYATVVGSGETTYSFFSVTENDENLSDTSSFRRRKLLP